MKTLRIKPTHESQGAFVVINETDFDPNTMVLFDEEALAAKGAKKPSDGLKVDELKEALAAKGVEIPEGVTLKLDLAALLDAQPTE